MRVQRYAIFLNEQKKTVTFLIAGVNFCFWRGGCFRESIWYRCSIVYRGYRYYREVMINKKVLSDCLGLSFAVRTGLEPATPCVTGMYSNQAELPHQNVLNRCSLFASAKVQLFSELTRVVGDFLQKKLKKTYVLKFFSVVMPRG